MLILRYTTKKKHLIKLVVQVPKQKADTQDLTGLMITTHQKADIVGIATMNFVKIKQEIQQTMVWVVGTTIVPTVFAVL